MFSLGCLDQLAKFESKIPSRVNPNAWYGLHYEGNAFSLKMCIIHLPHTFQAMEAQGAHRCQPLSFFFLSRLCLFSRMGQKYGISVMFFVYSAEKNFTHFNTYLVCVPPQTQLFLYLCSNIVSTVTELCIAIIIVSVQMCTIVCAQNSLQACNIISGPP